MRISDERSQNSPKSHLKITPPTTGIFSDLAVLVFYCCTTNNHKQQLKTTSIYQLTVLYFKSSGQTLCLGCNKTEINLLVSGQAEYILVILKIHFINVKLIVIDRIQFLVVVGLRSLFPSCQPEISLRFKRLLQLFLSIKPPLSSSRDWYLRPHFLNQPEKNFSTFKRLM